MPGEKTFTIKAPEKLSEKQKKALEFIQTNILTPFGSTGVQEVLDQAVWDLLGYLAIYPGGINKLEVQGVFVEVGILPNSEIVKDLVKLNERKEVVVDSKTQQTSRKGIWAAGDITDCFYRQNNISVGDAIKAVLNIHDYLQKSS